MKETTASNPPNEKAPETSPSRFRLEKPKWWKNDMVLFGLVAVFVALLLFNVYRMNANDQAIESALVQATKQLALVTQRLNESDNRYAELAGQFQVTARRLGLTESELSRARQMASNIKKEQEARVQELTQQLEQKAAVTEVAALQQETQSKLGTLSTDVTTTKEEVAATGKDIAEARKQLGDLQMLVSEHGTLIARNQEELSLLRRKGEKDYFEFDLRKGEFKTVSDLRLKLKKADVGKQRYDIEFYADDQKRERNKVNVNEPIQVFVGGLKVPFEIVVNQVQKDRVAGYISTPKDRVAAAGQPIP
jgi:chromosome segregation ATPase